MKIAIAFLLVSLHCLCAVPVDKKDGPLPKVPQPIPKVPEPAPKPVPKAPEPAPKPVPKVPEPAPKPVPKVPEPAPKPVPKVPEPAPKPVPKVPEPAPKPVPKEPQPAPKPVPNEPQPEPQPVPNPPPKQPAPKPVPLIDCLTQLLKKDAPALLQNLGTLLCNYRVAQQEQNIALFMNFLNQVNNILKEVGCSLDNLVGRRVVITAQNAELLSEQVAVVLFQFVEDIIARVVKILDDIPIVRDIINDGPLTQDVRQLACSVLESLLEKISHYLTLIADITGGITKIIEGL